MKYKSLIGKSRINFGTGIFAKENRLKSNVLFSSINKSYIPRIVNAETEKIIEIEGPGEITITNKGAEDTIYIYLPFAIIGAGPIHILIAENTTVYIIPKETDKFRDLEIGQSKTSSVSGDRIDLFCNENTIWDYSEIGFNEILPIPVITQLAGADNGTGKAYILSSTDNGETWSQSAQQGTIGEMYDICYLGNGIFLRGTGVNQSVERSTDYGENWAGVTGSYYKVLSLTYLGNGIAIGATNYYAGNDLVILRSTDYGENWSEILKPYATCERIDILCNVGNGIVLGGCYRDGHIVRSTDYGATWTDLGAQTTGVLTYYAICNLGSGIIVAGGDDYGKIVRSTDYGANWTDLGSIFGGRLRTYSMCNLLNGIVIASVSDGHFYKSIDYGLNWTDLGSFGVIYKMINVGNGIIIGGSLGAHIFRSTDYGVNWSDLGQQFSLYRIRGMGAV